MANLELTGGQYAMLMLFGTATCTYGTLEAVRVRSMVKSSIDPAMKLTPSKHSEPLSLTFPSVYSFFKDMTVLGNILLLVYMCENFPINAQGQKEWDRDMYYFLCLLLLVVSLCNIKKGKCTDILNRDQTEEWKGWMQFMFLLYHYYHAEEVYNAIRIMITCYVWMTGFGNFSFFWIKQDFGLVRLLQMLWRLNFLVILLCMSLNNTYILYYICPLHTFYFFVVFITMRIFPQKNHGKWDIRFKIMTLALAIFFIWEAFDGQVFGWIFSLFLSQEPCIGAKSGALWEWYFRTSLDNWSTILGMIFALNFPLAMKWLTKIEEQPMRQQVLSKGLVGVVVGSVFVWWVTNVFMQSKLQYNLTNSYYGFIPLLAYVYFRNVSFTLRSYYLGTLHDLGKITLESYLMQHHIWLTSNAKTLLVLLPGYPKINMLLCSLLFLVVSKTMFSLTMTLRGMLLPDDYQRCTKGAILIGLVMASLYGLGVIMSFLDLGVGFAFLLIFLCTSFVLLGLFRHVEGLRSGDSLAGAPRMVGVSGDGVKSMLYALTRAAFLVFLFTLPVRSHYPRKPPPGPSPHLEVSANPDSCLRQVNDGGWEVTGCNGKGSAPDAFCSIDAFEWSKPTATCKFHAFNTKQAVSLLGGKKVVVVGDSVGRKMYYQLLASLGFPSTNAHNATMGRHEDMYFTNKEKGLEVSFLWRPLMEDINKELAGWKEAPKGDVLLVDAGLWDALHKHDLDDFEASLKQTSLTLLELQPHVWFKSWLLPTAIVDLRLTTEDKRKYLTEDQVTRYRAATRTSEMTARVEVVLDGHALTKDVPSKNIDGVHYDDDIYTVITQVFLNGVETYQRSHKFPKGEGAGTRRSLLGEDGSSKEGLWGVPRRILVGGKGRFPDGSMSSVAHGLLLVGIVALFLVTMDNYGGASNIAIRFFTDVHLTWEDAYEPLLAKMFRTSPSPVPAPSRRPYQTVPQVELEMSEKDDEDDNKLIEEVKD